MDTQDAAVVTTAYGERDLLAKVQELLGQRDDTSPLQPDDIPVDQYHSGGREAVYRVIEELNIVPDDRVLDVGSGFGGPARVIAAHTGATVHGVDITTEYVDVARWLTEQTGQQDRVHFTNSEIAEFVAAEPFDVALTMHVQMNVEGKSSWYRSIGEHLRSNGTLAIWEICSTDNSALTWPMPWSVTGDNSFVVTQPELRRAIENAGFETTTWVDDSAWLKEWFAAAIAAGPGTNPGLSLIDNGLARALNFAMAFNTGQLSVVRATFRRTT